MAEIARMRTIKRALAELKLIDPETCITENFLRGQIRTGTIRSIRAGNRALLSMEELENLIESMSKPADIAPAVSGIRKVVEVRR